MNKSQPDFINDLKKTFEKSLDSLSFTRSHEIIELFNGLVSEDNRDKRNLTVFKIITIIWEEDLFSVANNRESAVFFQMTIDYLLSLKNTGMELKDANMECMYYAVTFMDLFVKSMLKEMGDALPDNQVYSSSKMPSYDFNTTTKHSRDSLAKIVDIISSKYYSDGIHKEEYSDSKTSLEKMTVSLVNILVGTSIQKPLEDDLNFRILELVKNTLILILCRRSFPTLICKEVEVLLFSELAKFQKGSVLIRQIVESTNVFFDIGELLPGTNQDASGSSPDFVESGYRPPVENNISKILFYYTFITRVILMCFNTSHRWTGFQDPDLTFTDPLNYKSMDIGKDDVVGLLKKNLCIIERFLSSKFLLNDENIFVLINSTDHDLLDREMKTNVFRIYCYSLDSSWNTAFIFGNFVDMVKRWDCYLEHELLSIIYEKHNQKTIIRIILNKIHHGGTKNINSLVKRAVDFLITLDERGNYLITQYVVYDILDKIENCISGSSNEDMNELVGFFQIVKCCLIHSMVSNDMKFDVFKKIIFLYFKISFHETKEEIFLDNLATIVSILRFSNLKFLFVLIDEFYEFFKKPRTDSSKHLGKNEFVNKLSKVFRIFLIETDGTNEYLGFFLEPTFEMFVERLILHPHTSCVDFIVKFLVVYTKVTSRYKTVSFNIIRFVFENCILTDSPTFLVDRYKCEVVEFLSLNMGRLLFDGRFTKLFPRFSVCNENRDVGFNLKTEHFLSNLFSEVVLDETGHMWNRKSVGFRNRFCGFLNDKHQLEKISALFVSKHHKINNKYTNLFCYILTTLDDILGYGNQREIKGLEDTYRIKDNYGINPKTFDIVNLFESHWGEHTVSKDLYGIYKKDMDSPFNNVEKGRVNTKRTKYSIIELVEMVIIKTYENRSMRNSNYNVEDSLLYKEVSQIMELVRKDCVIDVWLKIKFKLFEISLDFKNYYSGVHHGISWIHMLISFQDRYIMDEDEILEKAKLILGFMTKLFLFDNENSNYILDVLDHLAIFLTYSVDAKILGGVFKKKVLDPFKCFLCIFRNTSMKMGLEDRDLPLLCGLIGNNMTYDDFLETIVCEPWNSIFKTCESYHKVFNNNMDHNMSEWDEEFLHVISSERSATFSGNMINGMRRLSFHPVTLSSTLFHSSMYFVIRKTQYDKRWCEKTLVELPQECFNMKDKLYNVAILSSLSKNIRDDENLLNILAMKFYGGNCHKDKCKDIKCVGRDIKEELDLVRYNNMVRNMMAEDEDKGLLRTVKVGYGMLLDDGKIDHGFNHSTLDECIVNLKRCVDLDMMDGFYEVNFNMMDDFISLFLKSAHSLFRCMISKGEMLDKEYSHVFLDEVKHVISQAITIGDGRSSSWGSGDVSHILEGLGFVLLNNFEGFSSCLAEKIGDFNVLSEHIATLYGYIRNYFKGVIRLCLNYTKELVVLNKRFIYKRSRFKQTLLLILFQWNLFRSFKDILMEIIHEDASFLGPTLSELILDNSNDNQMDVIVECNDIIVRYLLNSGDGDIYYKETFEICKFLVVNESETFLNSLLSNEPDGGSKHTAKLVGYMTNMKKRLSEEYFGLRLGLKQISLLQDEELLRSVHQLCSEIKKVINDNREISKILSDDIHRSFFENRCLSWFMKDQELECNVNDDNGKNHADDITPYNLRIKNVYKKRIGDILELERGIHKNKVLDKTSYIHLYKTLVNFYDMVKQNFGMVSRVALRDVSPSLHYRRFSLLDFPSDKRSRNRCSDGGKSGCLHILDSISIIHTRIQPKKIKMIKGNQHKHYLIKAYEDIGLEYNVSNLISLASDILGDKEDLVRTYSIIPLEKSFGLIEWVEGGVSLYTLYMKWCNGMLENSMGDQKTQDKGNASVGEHENICRETNTTSLLSNPIKLYRKLLESHVYRALHVEIQNQGFDRTSDDYKIHIVGEGDIKEKVIYFACKEDPAFDVKVGLFGVKKSVFLDMKAMMSRSLLTKEIFIHSSTFSDYLVKTKSFINSFSVMSLLTFLFGIGDRHPANILHDFDNGSIVHIDLNASFDRGKHFTVPETVPFRFTQVYQDMVLSPSFPYGLHQYLDVRMNTNMFEKGNFANSLKRNMSGYMKRVVASKTLVAYWFMLSFSSSSVLFASNVNQEDVDTTSSGSYRFYETLCRKLDHVGFSSIDHLIENIVEEACSINSLSLMYEGWMSWL